MSGAPDRTSASGPLGSGQAFRVAAVAAMAIAAALAGPDAAHATTDTTFGSPRDPWRMEAWENPFARDGPASPFWAGEAMLEAEGSPTAPFLPMLVASGARIDGLRLLDGTLIVKIEEDGRAVQIRVTRDGPLLAGGGLRLYHDYGLELPMEIARLTDLWSVSGGPAPRQGRVRWARNGSC